MTIFKFFSAVYFNALVAQELDWIDFSGAGFSLWVLVLARTNPHRLKPAPLKTHKLGKPRHIVSPLVLEVVIQKDRWKQAKIERGTRSEPLDDLPRGEIFFVGIGPR